MYQNAFAKLSPKEVSSLLDILNPKFDGSAFDAEKTTILAQDISFYNGYRILDIADFSSLPAKQRFVVFKNADDFFIINFSNEIIYEHNKKIPISLEESNIFDYVRFFFSYVRGKKGNFLVVESVDDINWRDDPPPNARKAIGELINVLTLEKIDEDKNYNIRACMVFKDSLFRCLVKIDTTGYISLHEEELLVEDIPVLDDVLAQ